MPKPPDPSWDIHCQWLLSELLLIFLVNNQQTQSQLCLIPGKWSLVKSVSQLTGWVSFTYQHTITSCAVFNFLPFMKNLFQNYFEFTLNRYLFTVTAVSLVPSQKYIGLHQLQLDLQWDCGWQWHDCCMVLSLSLVPVPVQLSIDTVTGCCCVSTCLFDGHWVIMSGY